MRLHWDSGPGLEVTDRAQLDRALRELLAGPAAERPLIAYLTGAAGALGLGLDPAGSGLLLFAPADRGRPALHGAGQQPATGGDIVFSVSGRPHHFSARCRLPAPTVLAAARHYLATGDLPDCVTWEPEPAVPPGRGS
jgi:immunity protein Imm1 of predicted polymorphic toxin system